MKNYVEYLNSYSDFVTQMASYYYKKSFESKATTAGLGLAGENNRSNELAG